MHTIPSEETQSTSTTEAKVSLEQSPYHCPVCAQSDRTAKVTAIVARDTHHISGTTQEWISDEHGRYWSTVPFSGTQMSELARKLTPPARPDYSPSGWWYVVPLVGLGLILVWFAPVSSRMKRVIAFIVGIYLLATVLLFGSMSVVVSIGTEEAMAALAVPACVVISAAIAFFPAYYKGLSEETARRRAEIEAKDEPSWQKAMERWDRLYYCARDDCVFDPITGESTPVEMMREFLYSSHPTDLHRST